MWKENSRGGDRVGCVLRAAPLAAILVWSCAGCTTGPANDGIAGDYVATKFLAITSNATVDLLAVGASLTLVLTSSGTVSGALSVPDTEFGPGLSADMAGTYTTTGTTARFHQAADTFVRDMSWVFQGNTLAASGNAGGGVSVTVILTRQ